MSDQNEYGDYEHLRLTRETGITERHRRADNRPRFTPERLRQFARELAERLRVGEARIAEDLPGYDDRFLIKILLRQGESLPAIEAFPGIELVSHEDRTVVLAFASQSGLQE